MYFGYFCFQFSIYELSKDLCAKLTILQFDEFYLLYFVDVAVEGFKATWVLVVTWTNQAPEEGDCSWRAIDYLAYGYMDEDSLDYCKSWAKHNTLVSS